MPSLAASLLETVIPGPTPRRIWQSPEVQSHALVLLTFDRLYLAPTGGQPSAGRVAALEKGAEIEAVLGPLATVVNLSAVRQAKLDLVTNSLALDYAVRGQGPSRMTVVFANPEAADACFMKVWRRLGKDFELLPYKKDIVALARPPVMAILVVLAATLVLALAAGGYPDFAAARAAGAVSVAGAAAEPAARSAVEAAFGWLSWKAVCGVGGIAAAGLQVWLYRRLTSPPLSLEIARG